MSIRAFFLENIKKIFLAVLLALIIVLALYLWQSLKNRYSEKDLFLVEQAELALSQWRAAEGTQRDRLGVDLDHKMQVLDALKLSFQTQARQQFLEGCYAFWVKKDFEVALSKFASISSSYYQYAPSLLYQAYIYEEKGDLEQAYRLYVKLSELSEPFFKSQGLFQQALILEKQGDLESAETLYRAVLNGYPQVLWAQLSKNRLVYWAINS